MATIGLDTFPKQSLISSKINSLPVTGRRTASHSNVTAALMMVADIGCVLIALALSLRFGLASWLEPGETLRHLVVSSAPLHWQLGYLAWFLLTLLLVAHHNGLYGSTLVTSMLNEQRRTVQSCLTAGSLLCGAMYMMHNVTISRAVVIYLVCLTTCLLCISRVWWRYVAVRRQARGLDSRNVLVVGMSGMALALYRQIERNRHSGRAFKGFLEVSGNHASTQVPREYVIGSVEQIRYLSKLHFVDEIIIAECCSGSVVLNIVKIARECGIEVLVVPEFYDGIAPGAPVQYVGGFPVVSIHHRNERAIASFIKRITDVVLSGVMLLLSLPLLLTIAAAVKLDSQGPLFYVSERIGKKGRVFRCFKFRTMVINAEQLKDSLAAQNERSGILFKIKNDPRITRVGRVLRKYSLDEIPQIFNVLRGEMSLVGPRPPLANEVQQYELEHMRRLEVLPGLTGLWQVRARQDPSFERYVGLDLAYVENWSIWLDFKILIRTAKVVVCGTGS